MLIEVSIGEALDKLNILEIKLERIKSEDRLINIRQELEGLKELRVFRDKYAVQYRLLNHINRKIWDLTNLIKSMQYTDPNYARIALEIFDLNQSRFRIKNIINRSESGLKEEKSYTEASITLIIDDLDLFYSKLNLINYLSTKYDKIIIQTQHEAVKKIFSTCNYIYQDSLTLNDGRKLNELEIPTDIEIYNFPTIKYIAGGLLGDFVHQLSIINEKFRETGRKADLYLANIGDPFRFGLEKAYADTQKIVCAQPYISTYQIFNGESIDINLSEWRDSPLVFKENWKIVFHSIYNVDWGSHSWLSLPKIPYYRDTIIISYTPRRPIKETEVFISLKNRSVLFLTFDFNEYLEFSKITHTNFDCLKLNSLEQMASIINSCALFIGNMSAPLTLALATHKKCIVMFNDDVEGFSMRYLNLYEGYSYLEYNDIDSLTID